MARKINTVADITSGKIELSDADIIRETTLLEKSFTDSKEDWVEVTLPESVARLVGSPYYGSFNGVPYTLVVKEPKRLPKPIAEHVNQIIINAK